MSTTAEVVLLTRRPLDRYPVWEWVPDANVRVIASGQHRASAVSAPVEVCFVDEYPVTPMLDLAVLDLAREREFDHLIAFSEYDVLRAARLRGVLDLAGQRERSAVAFRDKAVMKAHWQHAGVAAPDHCAVAGAADLIAFGRRVGWPVVVKPRWGSGSIGVSVLADDLEARRWLGAHWRMDYDEVSPWMAEAFVAGRMFQVDGIYRDGRCEINWPTWVSSLLELEWVEGQSHFSLALEPGDPLVPGIRELVECALRALPDPDGPIVYHAEVWQRDGDGGLMMNEVAARVGGGLTRSLVTAGFGIDLVERFAQATIETGRPLAAAPDAPHTVAGEVGVPPGIGVVASVEDLSARLATPWIHTAAVKAQVGQCFSGPSDSSDTVAEAVVTGTSSNEVKERLETVSGWLWPAVRYYPRVERAGRHLQPVPSGPQAQTGNE